MQDHEDETELHDEAPAELTGDAAPEEAAGAGALRPNNCSTTAQKQSRKSSSTPRLPTSRWMTAMSWYIIHTYSGFEKKVRDSLVTRAEAFGSATRSAKS